MGNLTTPQLESWLDKKKKTIQLNIVKIYFIYKKYITLQEDNRGLLKAYSFSSYVKAPGTIFKTYLK